MVVSFLSALQHCLRSSFTTQQLVTLLQLARDRRFCFVLLGKPWAVHRWCEEDANINAVEDTLGTESLCEALEGMLSGSVAAPTEGRHARQRRTHENDFSRPGFFSEFAEDSVGRPGLDPVCLFHAVGELVWGVFDKEFSQCRTSTEEEGVWRCYGPIRLLREGEAFCI